MTLLVLITGLPATGKSTMAEVAARELGTPVLGHDWAMSGLRPFAEVQAALDAIAGGHRSVGWSILWALARAELRMGGSVVLDGVARAPEVAATRALAVEEGAGSLVVMTECADAAVHRSRVEGRQRLIPNWYELDWDHVEAAHKSWVPLQDVDLVLGATAAVTLNADLLRRVIADMC
jgi:predicted kinase